MGFAADITRQVRAQYSMHFSYPPGQPLQLGDIVVPDAGTWTVVGNLAKRAGVSIDVVEDPTPADWSPSATSGCNIETKAAATLDPKFKFVAEAKAGVKITLNDKNAFALAMKGARFRRIADVDEFWDHVRGEVNKWTWDLRRRIVTSVTDVESMTFLASAEGGSSFELEAAGSPNVSGLQLGDISAGFTLKSTMSANDVFSSLAATPLFRAHKVKLLGPLGTASVASGDVAWEEQGDLGDDEA
ncbi:hypothetical protein [Nocardioides sp. W7]|uniref:hypothetical protein n=1 Tax=Nocardioides sp. W7 TaxID=2931390 RepID=UPI001FD1FF25|nr:hypothetical protein [Nocardioides sp. W7]